MDLKDIAFPHLGIYLSNLPKNFSVFGFTIAFYGVLIGLGVLAGVFTAVKISKLEHMDEDIIWDFAIYAVICSVICARLYYVVFSWDLYKNDLLSIFNTRQGGLAIYGGVIGGFLTLFIYSHIKKVKVFDIGDCSVFGLVLGQIIGRWGNFFNREAFGEYTNSFLAMRLPADAVRVQDITTLQRTMMESAGVNYIQVHPTFFYEGFLNLCVLIFMIFYRKHKKFSGEMCLIYLGGYGIIRFFVEGLRTDPLLIPGTMIPVSQTLGMALFVGAVVIDLIVRSRLKKSAVDTDSSVEEKQEETENSEEQKENE